MPVDTDVALNGDGPVIERLKEPQLFVKVALAQAILDLLIGGISSLRKATPSFPTGRSYEARAGKKFENQGLTLCFQVLETESM